MSEGDPFRPEEETFSPEGKKKSGMSTAAKVIIGIVVTGVVGFAVCCGGFFFWASSMVTQDPAEIRDITATIASIDIPPGWEPVVGVNMKVPVRMQMVMYSPDPTNQSRLLMLMQMQEGDEAQMEMQMEMQMSQQGRNQNLTIQSRETRSFTIDGQEQEFEFAVGTNSAGDTVHRVSGTFPGKDGMAMLMMTEDDADWDEAAVEKMIESISTQ